jgi:hypothetical protein
MQKSSDELFYDYASDLEKEWKSETKRLSNRKLLELFPDIRGVVLDKLNDWKIRRNRLNNTIKQKIIEIKSMTPPKDWWFCRLYIKYFHIPDLSDANSHVKRLNHLLYLIDNTGKSLPKGQLREEQIEQARSIPVESLIDTPLRKSSNNFISLCPLHNEKTPSFYIYTNTNSFHCFGCGEGGDGIKLIRALNNYSFQEAVLYLNKN